KLTTGERRDRSCTDRARTNDRAPVATSRSPRCLYDSRAQPGPPERARGPPVDWHVARIIERIDVLALVAPAHSRAARTSAPSPIYKINVRSRNPAYCPAGIDQRASPTGHHPS